MCKEKLGTEGRAALFTFRCGHPICGCCDSRVSACPVCRTGRLAPDAAGPCCELDLLASSIVRTAVREVRQQGELPPPAQVRAG